MKVVAHAAYLLMTNLFLFTSAWMNKRFQCHADSGLVTFIDENHSHFLQFAIMKSLMQKPSTFTKFCWDAYNGKDDSHVGH